MIPTAEAEHVAAYGIREAVAIRELELWIGYQRNQGKSPAADGRTYTSDAEVVVATAAPRWPKGEARRVLRSLKRQSVLVSDASEQEWAFADEAKHLGGYTG